MIITIMKIAVKVENSVSFLKTDAVCAICTPGCHNLIREVYSIALGCSVGDKPPQPASILLRFLPFFLERVVAGSWWIRFWPTSPTK